MIFSGSAAHTQDLGSLVSLGENRRWSKRATFEATLGQLGEEDLDGVEPGGRSWDVMEHADELLVPVTLHKAVDHLAVEHVEGDKQRGGAVPVVIVGRWSAAPGRDQQARLGNAPPIGPQATL
jgi:hypothetical protein